MTILLKEDGDKYLYLNQLHVFTETVSVLFKGLENIMPLLPQKPDGPHKLPTRAAPPKPVLKNKTENHTEEPTVGSLQAEIKELKIALELLQTRQEWVPMSCTDPLLNWHQCDPEIWI